MRVRPQEAIHYVALLLLSALTFAMRRRLPDPEGALLTYAAVGLGLLLVTVLAQREERLPTPLAILVDFYPTILLPIVFNTLGPLIRAVSGSLRDEPLIAADRALFGTDVTVWLERFTHPLLNDLLFLFYATYYFIGLALGAVLWRRDRATAHRLIFTLMLVYYVSYAGYFTLPALGPRYAQADLYTVSLETSPVARAISGAINTLEKTKADAFPSGHTMIAVAVLMVAWRRARNVFPYFLLVASGLIVSTVYCRYHYVVDVLAGILIAAVTVPVGDALYDRLVEARGSRLPKEISPAAG